MKHAKGRGPLLAVLIAVLLAAGCFAHLARAAEDPAAGAYEDGLKAMDEGRYHEAIVKFKEAQDKGYKDNAAVKCRTAECYLELGKRNMARFVLHTIADSNYVPALVALARSYIYYPPYDTEQGIHYLKKALKIDPGNVEARLCLGNTYILKREFHEAKEQFEEIIEKIDPYVLDAYFGLADTYLYKGRPLKSLQSLAKAARLAPDSAEVYYRMGKVYLRTPWLKNHFQKAVSYFDKAARLAPGDIRIQAAMASAYILSGNDIGARELLNRLVSEAPDHSYTHWLKGVLLEHDAHVSMAMDEYKKAIERWYFNTHAHYTLANLYFGTGSKEYAALATSTQPYKFAALKDHAKAEEEYRKVLAIDPNFEYAEKIKERLEAIAKEERKEKPFSDEESRKKVLPRVLSYLQALQGGR